MDCANNLLKERTTWLESLFRQVRPSRIVEFGCGSGFVLEFLSPRFPDSVILGIDRSMERLKRVAEKELPNVTAVKADFMKPLLQDWSVDTIILAATLHEVFSDFGEVGVLDTLKAAGDALTHGGVLIIQDYLKPNPKQVELCLSSDRVKARFTRFVREFRPRTVLFQESVRGVQIDIADALDFLDQQCATTEADWAEAMKETHRFYSEADYRRAAGGVGLLIRDMQIMPRSNAATPTESDEISFDFEYTQDWIQLVMAKHA